LRLFLNTLLRLVTGTYFVLSSIYCLLAFLPYTFFFLIKAPPYAWMPWFVQHQAMLYCVAAIAVVAANWRVREAWTNQRRGFLYGTILLVATAIYVAYHPFLATIDDTRKAYWWSLLSLLPLIALAFWRQADKTIPSEPRVADHRELGYSGAALAACVVCVIYAAGSRVRGYNETRTIGLHWADAELTLWSLVSHIMLAVVVVSLINLIFVLASRTARPQWVRRAGVCALVFASLWIALSRFLGNALSFAGWSASLYAGTLALALTLWGFSIARPFLDASKQTAQPTLLTRWSERTVACIVLLASATLAVAFPFLVHGADWSGILEGTVTLLVWVAVGVCLSRIRPARVQYSALAILLVLAGSAAAYKALQTTEIFWSRPLGSTDDEISLALEAYSGQDISFQLAHHILGNGRSEVCGDLCRILREYTNIRDAQARVNVQLVDTLAPARGPRPNIFVFVIDSMRPDYLGSYNPRVDFTPNLDAFAKDSVVLHHVYSQYAGTSLSEPAIWSGAMMLHAHYPEPFSRLNSLDRLLDVDDYRKLVSIDEVLGVLLSSSDRMIKLDTDKKLWNNLELGSTLRQAQTVLDAQRNTGLPVFLYTQPKNVHQFARNDVPSPTSQHWQAPAGMNGRISYEVHWVDKCLGEFFNYLKQRGIYDDSIIIVTSDHGDATGEFGRLSHSTLIWPEVMQVPLIIHLPRKMRDQLVYDDTRISTLTDIAPTLYYLLGHRPIEKNPLYGRPLFAETKAELDRYPRKDLLLASDVRAVYGILTADGRYLYTTYDSPAESHLFDLTADPNAEHNILSPQLKQHYDEEIIDHLHGIADFYGYKPGMGSLLASAGH
jgi:hypothetical protein